jgi:hypothetical protein
MLVDQKTNEMYIPLNSLIDGQTGYLEVCMTCVSDVSTYRNLYFQFNTIFTLKYSLGAEKGWLLYSSQTVIQFSYQNSKDQDL